jgi:recombination protein RecT
MSDKNAKSETLEQTKSPAKTNADAVKDVIAKVKKDGNLSNLQSTQIGTLFDQYKVQIAQALPRHLSADRLIQMVVTLISQNPELKNCSVGSLIGATMQASILGFKPVSALGHCYFVPYNNKKKNDQGKDVWVKEVQFQIGYKGYIDLARRSGEIRSIHASGVYKDDDFKYNLGLHPDIKHVPSGKKKEAKNLTHVYAVAHYKDGGYNFIVLTREEVEALRMRNAMQKQGLKGAWLSDYEAMSCAKAIKQLAKYMPLSDEMSRAVLSDEAILKPDHFANDKSGDLVETETPDFEDITIAQPDKTEEE